MSDFIYEFIASRRGPETVLLTRGDKETFLHSKYDPIKEAKAFADNIYSEDVEVFLVIGLALGYHVQALAEKLTSNQEIIVLEANKELYSLADKDGFYDKLKKKQQITLHLATDLKSYANIFLDYVQKEKIKLLVYGPSLETFPSELNEIKELIEEYRMKEDSIHRHADLLSENFQENIENYQHVVNELFGKYANRLMIMVAAGPSLDKNIHLLIDLEGKIPIVAVGRAVRPLTLSGIIPDYIVITEPKPRSYNQIKNIEAVQNVPVIVLSTADQDILAKHPGDKYIAFQSGVNESENYAQEHGLDLIETGGSVATATFDIAIRMGANPLIMVGQDLAYTDGRTHSSGTWHREVKDAPTRREVEGYYGGKITTIRNLDIYRRWFETRIRELRTSRPDLVIIDATEGGAMITGTQIRTLAETLEKYLKH